MEQEAREFNAQTMLTASEYEAIRAAAEADHRSISAWLRLVILREIKKKGKS